VSRVRPCPPSNLPFALHIDESFVRRHVNVQHRSVSGRTNSETYAKYLSAVAPDDAGPARDRPLKALRRHKDVGATCREHLVKLGRTAAVGLMPLDGRRQVREAGNMLFHFARIEPDEVEALHDGRSDGSRGVAFRLAEVGYVCGLHQRIRGN
jgi:hypothetical protein